MISPPFPASTLNCYENRENPSPPPPRIKTVFCFACLLQINFVACQLFALLAAFWFRIYLSPSHASSAVRHAFATLFGIYFAVFCFGW